MHVVVSLHYTLKTAHLLLQRMGVDEQCQVTHKLLSWSTGPLSLSAPPLAETQTATFNQPVSCMANTFCVCESEEMTSQTCHKRSENRWGPNRFRFGFDKGKTCRLESRFWTSHCQQCLLDMERHGGTLHVKVGLFFSQTLWWVVSSCWQYIYCFTINTNAF